MTLAEVCVKRPVFAVMLISFLVVLGIFSFRDLGVDLFPKADPATVTINARLPGATPEEMTTQVVFPLEEAVSRYGMQSESFARVSWRHENFINACWQGIRVFDFRTSYTRLKEILGDKFPTNPNWQRYQPTPQTLKEIAETLS